MRIVVKTEPAIEPITTNEMKNWLKIETSVSADDSLILSLIKSARIFCEDYTGRKLITQDIEGYRDGLPWGHCTKWWDGVRTGALSSLETVVNFFEIPVAPIQAPIVFKYYDTANTEYTFSAASYYVDYQSSPPKLTLNSGYSWPSNLRDSNSIILSFKAGYGDESTNVPDNFITAIKNLVSFWYEHRGDSAIDSIPKSVYLILNQYCLSGGL